MKSSVRVVPLERVRAPLLAVALGELSNNKVPSSLLSLDANLRDLQGSEVDMSEVPPR